METTYRALSPYAQRIVDALPIDDPVKLANILIDIAVGLQDIGRSKEGEELLDRAERLIGGKVAS